MEASLQLTTIGSNGLDGLAVNFTLNGDESNFIGNVCNVTTDLTQSVLQLQFEVVPTVVANTLSIRSVSATPTVDIQIFDSAGRMVFQDRQVSTNAYDISVGAFAAGLYFIKVSNDLGSQTLKFVKVHGHP